jgi:hypothetical protein
MRNEIACECTPISNRVIAQCDHCATEEFRKTLTVAGNAARNTAQTLTRLAEGLRSR